MPEFYSTDNYKGGRRLTTKKVQDVKVKDYYYTKSSRAIEDIAKKIVKEVRDNGQK